MSQTRGEWLRFIPDNDNFTVNPLAWWLDELRHNPHRFPTLGHIVIDLFSCPTMSTECERVFSKAKQLIINERNHLYPRTIEVNELQKDWL